MWVRCMCHVDGAWRTAAHCASDDTRVKIKQYIDCKKYSDVLYYKNNVLGAKYMAYFTTNPNFLALASEVQEEVAAVVAAVMVAAVMVEEGAHRRR